MNLLHEVRVIITKSAQKSSTTKREAGRKIAQDLPAALTYIICLSSSNSTMSCELHDGIQSEI